MLVHNNDIEHDGADKMSYVFDYCYEDKKGVSFVYLLCKDFKVVTWRALKHAVVQ